MPMTDVNAITTPPQHLSTQHSFTVSSAPVQPAIDPNLDPALMDQSAIDPSLDQAASPSHQQHGLLPSALPQLRIVALGTPDVDKSFSPITTESAEARSKQDFEEEQSHPGQSATDNVTFDGEVPHPQVNGAMHAAPVEISQVKQEPQIEQQRPATAVTGCSPKPEAVSSPIRRSSSQTSGTTHQAAAMQAPADADTVTVNQTPRQETSPQVKQEATTPAREFTRGDAIEGNSSDTERDASEKLAKELQAQEHGLRRRPSVRIS